MRGTTRALRRAGWMAGTALLLAACRDREAPPGQEPMKLDSIPQRVEARLYVAKDWAWNEEDTLRITVVNATEQPLTGQLHLFVGSPVEMLFDSASGPPPETMSSGEGTRVVFPLGTVAAGQTAEFRQAVRTPPAPDLRRRPSAESDTATVFAVRTWVSTSAAREMALSEDTIRIRPGSEVVTGGCGGVKDVAVTRYGIGPLRLEMRAADVRTLCPEARDTTWRGAEGTTERGMAVRLSGHPVLLLLNGQTVSRIQVDTAGLKTGVGVGVGATLGELRGRYGRTCAGQGEGRIAVWFPAAPGISFGLDSVTVAPPGPELDPAALPDTARVERMWVRAGTDDCPRPQP